MLKDYAAFFVQATDQLRYWQRHYFFGALAKSNAKELRGALLELSIHAKEIDLSTTSHLAKGLASERLDFDVIKDRIFGKMDSLYSAMAKELSDRRFLYVPNELVAYYERGSVTSPEAVIKSVPPRKPRPQSCMVAAKEQRLVMITRDPPPKFAAIILILIGTPEILKQEQVILGWLLVAACIAIIAILVADRKWPFP